MKKISFALLSVALILFAGCQNEQEVQVSDDAEVLDARPSSYEIKVESAGAWSLEGEYDWITPSAVSGNGGETITFSTRVNHSGLIRTAEFNLVSGSASRVLTFYQKPSTPDATLGLVIEELKTGGAVLGLNYITSFPEDYSEYGVYYATEADIAKAERKVFGTDTETAGKKEFEISDLDPSKDYYLWPFVMSVDKVEVVGSLLGLLPPVLVDNIADLQQALDNAREYAEVRVRGGEEYKGRISLRTNVTLSGGWNADFTVQDGELSVIDGNNSVIPVTVPAGVKGAVIKKFEIRNGSAVDGAGLNVMGQATVDGCWIHHNNASHRGGGIGTMEGQGADADLTLVNSIVSNNSCHEHGGGISLEDGFDCVMVNNLISENYSNSWDGFYGAIVVYNSSCTMVNNTFVKNYCGDNEGDGSSWPNVGFRGGATVFAYNNIMAGNMARTRAKDPKGDWSGAYRQQLNVQFDNYDGSTVTFKNNIVEGGFKKAHPASLLSDNKILASGFSLGTLFTDWDNADFSLSANSVAKDGGDLSDEKVAALIATYAKDLAGNDRVIGSKVDFGCYEAK